MIEKDEYFENNEGYIPSPVYFSRRSLIPRKGNYDLQKILDLIYVDSKIRSFSKNYDMNLLKVEFEDAISGSEIKIRGVEGELRIIIQKRSENDFEIETIFPPNTLENPRNNPTPSGADTAKFGHGFGANGGNSIPQINIRGVSIEKLVERQFKSR